MSDSQNPSATAAASFDTLSPLLLALAEAVRSASRLAHGDDYEFLTSLPEVSSELSGAQTELATVLQQVLRVVQDQNETAEHDDNDSTHEDDEQDAVADMVDDPALWQACADALEALLEDAELSLNTNTTATTETVASGSNLHSLTRQGKAQLSRLMQSQSDDVVKPQLAWMLAKKNWTPANGRTDSFVPAVHPQKPHSITPLNLSPLPGHGLESRYGTLKTTVVSQNIIAPSHYVDHVYRAEIDALQYADWMLQPLSQEDLPSLQQLDELTASWIETPQALQELVGHIYKSQARVIALDLEAHSHRSFAGLTCLMQLSYKVSTNDGSSDDASTTATIHNALIDTLALRFDLCEHLQPLLADPAIVKVFHGADSDMQWLQRDFGLYVVNLFDTGRAARVLGLPKHSYAYLLKHYVNIAADKSFQLADWRVRPLTKEMQHYAIQDTHYLLDIYERMKYDLSREGPDMIQKVLDVSRQVSLIRYAGEPFDPDGYKALWNQQPLRRRRLLNVASDSKTQSLDTQERVLKALWDWRDRVARELDESTYYVCGKQHLLRLALAPHLPTTVRGLQSLFTNMPPVLLERATEVLEGIKTAVNSTEEVEQPVGQQPVDNAMEEDGFADMDDDDDMEDEEIANAAPQAGDVSSAFIKPPSSYQKRHPFRERQSPVLATAALYKEAGWTTPEVPYASLNGSISDIAITTTDDDDGDSEMNKPKRLLSVHLDNKHFASGRLNNHTMSLLRNSQVVKAGGLATVAAQKSNSVFDSSKLAEHSQEAKQLSAKVGSTLLHEGALAAILSINTPTLEIDDPDIEDDLNGRSDGAETDEEDFAIPRSMREIYKISNRNRRNKKTGSPTPERGTTPTTDKEQDELAKADALLKERGLFGSPFFDDGSSKKQRTKVSDGRESEETVPQDQDDSEAAATREEDLKVLEEVGWGGATKEPPAHPFANTAGIGLLDPNDPNAQNPFFTGAALAGGPLAQDFSRQGQQPRPASSRNNNSAGRGGGGGAKSTAARTRERPEKKDGKTFHYRKR